MTRLSNSRSMTALVLALAFTWLATPDIAVAAGYLKIGDIKGESTRNKEHKGEIEILSWSWGETSSNRSSGLPTGKRQHKPITITKHVDKASPLLQQASTSGKAIPSMEITLPKEGGRAGEYMKYKLRNVYVSSYSVGGSGTGSRSVQNETFTLSYAESTVEPARIRQRNKTDVEFVRERARTQ